MSVWLRHSKTILVVSAFIAIPLFVSDWYSGGSLILPTVVGINLLILALKLLHWSPSDREQKREQERCLEEHLRREATQRAAADNP